MRSDNLNVGISSVAVRKVSSMNATTSPKATPHNFLSWSEKFPFSCLLVADRHKFLRQFLWYLASWAHCMKNAQIQSFFCTEIYCVNLRIQSEYRKIRMRKWQSWKWQSCPHSVILHGDSYLPTGLHTYILFDHVETTERDITDLFHYLRNHHRRSRSSFPLSPESPQKKQVKLSATDEWEERRNPANK